MMRRHMHAGGVMMVSWHGWLGAEFRASVLVVVVAVAVSCKDEEAGLQVDQEHYCSEVAKVACATIFSCCTGAEIEEKLGLTITTSEDECIRDVTLMCQEENAVLLHAIDSGTVKVDGAAATACLVSMQAPAECTIVASEADLADECKGPFFMGTQMANMPCVYHIECSANAYCGPNRRCKMLPGIDKPCDNQAPGLLCQQGLYCDQEYVCRPFLKAYAECDAHNPCGTGLFCFKDEEVDKSTCQSLKQLGVSCGGHQECQSGYCIPGVCNDGSQCFSDDECVGSCELTGEECQTDLDCEGSCEQTGEPCKADFDCFQEGDVCQHGGCSVACNGQPVCGEEYAITNYCDIGLGMVGGL
jgi:hypothetical protein